MLGLPVCLDAIQYNVHRYYGPRRLSMMTECWHLVSFLRVKAGPRIYSDLKIVK